MPREKRARKHRILVVTLFASAVLLVPIGVCALLIHELVLSDALLDRRFRREFDLTAIRSWADACLQSELSGAIPLDRIPAGPFREGRVAMAAIREDPVEHVVLRVSEPNGDLCITSTGEAPYPKARLLTERVYRLPWGGR